MKRIMIRNGLRWGKWLPALFVAHQTACLPNDALRLVLAENVVLTSAVIIQSLTSIFFNTLFGLI